MNWRVSIVAGAAVVGVVIVAIVLRRADGAERLAIDGDSVVMLGDSITAEGAWSTVLPDVAIVNAGRSGFTTAQLVPVATEIVASQPRMVFILTGTNDIRDDEPPSWTARHLAELLHALAAGSPDTQVILQTVLPRADRVQDVNAVNEEIRKLAAEQGLTLLDLHADFDDGNGALRRNETYDGIHLSDDGYERWATLLRTVIEPAS